jgi:hypothetical protein
LITRDRRSSCSFWTVISSLIVVSLLIVVLPLAYVFCLVMLLKRKDYQPLKSRSISLIFISTLGNTLFFGFFLVNKIDSSNYWS